MRTKPAPSEERVAPEERLRLALDTFLARIARRAHPEGGWQEGLWLPSPRERQACCAEIRPTTANRQALESHCRSQAHVAAFFGVEPTDLKAALRAGRREPNGPNEPNGPEDRRPEGAGDGALPKVVRMLRNVSVDQLQKAVKKALPPIARLQKIGPAEELAPLLAEALEAAEALLFAVKVADSLEVSLRRVNDLARAHSARTTAPPLGSAMAEWADRLEEEPLPRRAFEAAPSVRAA